MLNIHRDDLWFALRNHSEHVTAAKTQEELDNLWAYGKLIIKQCTRRGVPAWRLVCAYTNQAAINRLRAAGIKGGGQTAMGTRYEEFYKETMVQYSPYR